MSYNIVLTGVSSGIGSHLGNYLTKKGHKVIGLSRRTNTRNNFEILKCDISKIKQLKKILNKIQTNSNTALITLTHDPKIDDPALQHALKNRFFYIGALGSKKRGEKG